MINERNRPICSARYVRRWERARPLWCRLATARPCNSISTRPPPASHLERMPSCCSTRRDGMGQVFAGAQQHLAAATPAALAGVERAGEHLAVHAAELV